MPGIRGDSPAKHGSVTEASMIPASNFTRQRLLDLRYSLLRLHKILLDTERVSYDETHAPIASSAEFLQLVLGDDWFAYLRPLSQLVVRIDETLDEGELLTEEDAGAFLDQAHGLLRSPEMGKGLGPRYSEALQRNPDVVLAHAEVVKILRNGPPA